MGQKSTKAATPPHRRFFYGWVIVGVMSLVGALSMTLATLNFVVFIRPMGNELHIGRAMFGWSQTARTVTGAFTSPWIGRFVDRLGSRYLLAAAALLVGLSLVAMAFITAAWQMVALFAVMGVLALGGPAGNLLTTVPIAKWFVRKRGLAMALVGVGPFLGGVIFVPISQLFITDLGWRHAWIALAAIGMAGIIPLTLLFVRRQPEDMGQAPDGDPPRNSAPAENPSQAATTSVVVEETSWTLAEARRSPVFWRLVAAFSLAMFALGSIGLHRVPNFMDKGLDPGLVALATSLDAAGGGASTFLMGFVADRMQARHLGLFSFTVLTVAMVLTILGDTPLLLFLAMGSFGVGIGGLVLLQNYLWPQYFGRGHLGSIRGFITPITLLWSGISGPLAGYVKDIWGSYDSIWWVCVAMMALATLLIFSTSKPVKRPDP